MENETTGKLREIAHELTTPLAAIRCSIDTMETALQELQGGARSSELFAVFDDSLKTSRLACERIVSIVRDARKFTEVDIHACIDGALKLVSHRLNGRIKVVRSYRSVSVVRSDPDQLGQVFVNIFNNAALAVEGEGEIRIATWDEAGSVRIAITDTGCGIRPEVQRHIFDRGFTTKTEGEGTGLGLWICRQIVENQKGQIELESEVGRGSTFTIVLPATSLESRS